MKNKGIRKIPTEPVKISTKNEVICPCFCVRTYLYKQNGIIETFLMKIKLKCTSKSFILKKNKIKTCCF